MNGLAVAERDPLLSAPGAAPLPRLLRPPTVLLVGAVLEEALLGGRGNRGVREGKGSGGGCGDGGGGGFIRCSS